MSRPVSRRHAAALLLILATIAFAIGITAERSLAGEATAERPNESTGEVQSERTESVSGEESEGHADEDAETPAEETGAPHDEATEANETILGFNPESPGAITSAIVLSLALAAALWFWETSSVLIVVAIFALLFAALDLREVMHQLGESRASLAAIALVAALLHGGAGVIAGLSLTQRSSAA